MHILSKENRSEFLPTPQLIRFDYVDGLDGLEPTLLVKANTLLLKYIVRGAPMQLAFAMCKGRLLYALKIFDDGEDGGILWSIAEREEERNGFRGLARGEPLVAFLFNELAVNVAWNNLRALGTLDRLAGWLESEILDQAEGESLTEVATGMLDRLPQFDVNSDEWLVLQVCGKSDWNGVQNNFITSGGSSSPIHLFDNNEGKQQEQLGLWLTDNLHPWGVHLNPQIPKGNGKRELTDILLSHEFGAVLIESKTLSILTRGPLPSRAKLKRDVSVHIAKAFDQLRGAIRKLKSGIPVTSSRGDVLSVERKKPAHAIVLIPDFDLVGDRSDYDTDFMKEFMHATGGFVHLLDVSELLRIVQAAEIISARGTTTTPMMAFDFYLMERVKMAAKANTLCIEVLLRFADDEVVSKSA